MPKPPNLVARTSAFNTSVTLYEPADSSPPSPLRRSTRPKTPRQSPYSVPISDIEELVQDNVDDERESFRTSSIKKARTSQKTRATIAKAGTNSGTKSKAALPKKPLSAAHEPPSNWLEVYNVMKDIRARFVAPVDKMGCATTGPKLVDPDPRTTRFETLITLILSTQTKDEVTDAAMDRLRATLGGMVSIERVLSTSNEIIANAINKVAFWQLKAKSIRTTARTLQEKFDSDVPKTIEELTTLAGVGPKVGFLALQACWSLTHGIGVDTHVHRITNRLGWHSTKDNESTRVHLESWLPRDKWVEINHMMVGFGQVICLPVSPRCDSCNIGKKGLCPSREAVKNVEKRKPIPWLDSDVDPQTAQLQIHMEDIESMTNASVDPLFTEESSFNIDNSEGKVDDSEGVGPSFKSQTPSS